MGEIVTRRRVFPTGTHHAEVKTADGKVYRVIGLSSEDSKADLVQVLIEISPERAKPVIFKRKMPQVNDRVVVFSDVGDDQQIIEGTVSAIEESSLGKVLRISATIGPGSNGSPVFNTDGELVGVAVFSNSEATSFVANAAESLTRIVPAVSEETANITRPKALNNPAPVYTEAARRNGVEGSVYLRVLVGEDGKVEMAKVVRGLPDGLTEQALKAAYGLKFEPAKKEGKPVKYWIPILVEFKLGR
jgi:protein TonB